MEMAVRFSHLTVGVFCTVEARVPRRRWRWRRGGPGRVGGPVGGAQAGQGEAEKHKEGQPATCGKQ